jgi:hypothetical protein
MAEGRELPPNTTHESRVLCGMCQRKGKVCDASIRSLHGSIGYIHCIDADESIIFMLSTNTWSLHNSFANARTANAGVLKEQCENC